MERLAEDEVVEEPEIQNPSVLPEGSDRQVEQQSEVSSRDIECVTITKPQRAAFHRAEAGESGEHDAVDEVVSLRRCHHTFHSSCLTRWFLTGRYDCPVCRSVYWMRIKRQPTSMGRLI